MTERVDRSAVERGRRPESKLGSQPILTGHFQAGPRYGCKRWGGTDDWLLFCTTAGAGRIAHADGSLETGAGDLVLLSARHPHDYATATPPGSWEFTWAHFLPLPQWLPWLAWPEEAPGIHRLVLGKSTVFAAIAKRLREMDGLAAGERHHRFALALNALEEALLLADEANPARSGGGADARIRAVADGVRADLAREWDIAALAAAAGLSASRFAHLFRAEFGETPRRWIERQRMERARQLLTGTRLAVQEIAAQVGFADPFHFTARFRAVTGTAPTALRRKG